MISVSSESLHLHVIRLSTNLNFIMYTTVWGTFSMSLVYGFNLCWSKDSIQRFIRGYTVVIMTENIKENTDD